jgi:hypothetical protein
MGNYATVADVRNFKVAGQPIDLSGLTDVDIEDDIALAEEVVELVTGDIFYVKTETNKFDGSGLYSLHFVPQIPYQLLSVTSIEDVDPGSQVMYTYQPTDFVVYPYHIELTQECGDPRYNFGRSGVWPRGQQNIVIAGTWGNATCPAAIRRAVVLLTLERIMPGSTQMIPDGIAQAQWPDYLVTFKGRAAQGITTGYVEVDLLLEKHINHNGMFIVVPDQKQTYDGNRIKLVH